MHSSSYWPKLVESIESQISLYRQRANNNEAIKLHFVCNLLCLTPVTIAVVIFTKINAPRLRRFAFFVDNSLNRLSAYFCMSRSPSLHQSGRFVCCVCVLGIRRRVSDEHAIGRGSRQEEAMALRLYATNALRQHLRMSRTRAYKHTYIH